MISQDESRTKASLTAGFIDPWPWIALLSSGAAFLALLAVPGFSKTLFSNWVTVEPEDVAEVTQPFTLQSQQVGALRVDVSAVVPAGRWLTYEIQLRDSQGEILAAALKQAWHESGTWQEGGESGTWDEQDVRSGLDLQAQQAEQLTVSIAVLDYTDTAGQLIDEPVSFSVEIRDGIIDIAYLWPAVIGTSLLSLLAVWATRVSGEAVMVQQIDDSDVSDRAILGGPGNLVRAYIEVKSDETSPSKLTIKLRIRDGNGLPVYERKHWLKTQAQKDGDGNIQHYWADLKLFFLFEAVDSYGFAVEVVPDGPVDETKLTVCQRARTCLPVKALQIAPFSSSPVDPIS